MTITYRSIHFPKMTRRMKIAYPVPQPIPTMFLSVSRDGNITSLTRQQCVFKNCAPYHSKSLWLTFEYLLGKTPGYPDKDIYVVGPRSSQWWDSAYMRNLAVDILNEDDKGNFSMALVILRDGIAALTSKAYFNLHLQQDRLVPLLLFKPQSV